MVKVSASLPCYLSNGPLKQDFLDIDLITFSEFVSSKYIRYEGHFLFENVQN